MPLGSSRAPSQLCSFLRKVPSLRAGAAAPQRASLDQRDAAVQESRTWTQGRVGGGQSLEGHSQVGTAGVITLHFILCLPECKALGEVIFFLSVVGRGELVNKNQSSGKRALGPRGGPWQRKVVKTGHWSVSAPAAGSFQTPEAYFMLETLEAIPRDLQESGPGLGDGLEICRRGWFINWGVWTHGHRQPRAVRRSGS